MGSDPRDAPPGPVPPELPAELVAEYLIASREHVAAGVDPAQIAAAFSVAARSRPDLVSAGRRYIANLRHLTTLEMTFDDWLHLFGEAPVDEPLEMVVDHVIGEGLRSGRAAPQPRSATAPGSIRRR